MRKILLSLGLVLTAFVSKSQMYDAFVHQGEMGVGVGFSNYFGDLNNTASFNRPKFSAGIFYSKQFNNYISLRVSGNYAFLGYSDVYSDNPVQQRRNLSFNTNVWEITASGYFNFFKFLPGFPEYDFTPYVGLGVGVFTYDPYAYLNGEKIFLRPLGTEGQGSALYPNMKAYGTTALCVPFTVGVKKSLNERMNVYAELCYRFTNTDYLDDVSGVYAPDAYAPVDANGNPSTWYLMQDRSYETGAPIGVKGRQRGTSLQKDAFLTLHVGVSFNLQTYRCPTH